MNRDDALKKIKKCLALGRSAETHEAAAAMRQAQKLMAEHRVTETDVSLTDVVEIPVKACMVGLAQWEASLSSMVGDAFGCELYRRQGSRLTPSYHLVSEAHFVFVGIDAAPHVAAYAYEVLSRQCAKARLAHIALQPKRCKPITKTARGDEFAFGWVMSVRSLVEDFAGNNEADEQLLLTYMEAKHPGMKTVKARNRSKGRRIDGSHSSRGWAVGKDATLERGIGGRARQELLA